MRPPLNRLGGDYYRLSIMAVIELKSSKVTIALGKLSIVNKIRRISILKYAG